MRPVDFQTITAQTPGVEKSHQTRPQQAEIEQRVQQTVAQEVQNRKMLEAQNAPEDQASEMRLNAEEQGQKHGRREGSEADQDQEEGPDSSSPRSLMKGKRIDIVI